MILRLSLVTTLMAVFAVGMSTLVQIDGRQDALRASAGCHGQGAACVR